MNHGTCNTKYDCALVLDININICNNAYGADGDPVSRYTVEILTIKCYE